MIRDLEQFPEFLFKKLKSANDIWEIRIRFGNNIIKILGFSELPDKIVLTNAFSDKSSKTPDREIGLAEQRKQEYFERDKFMDYLEEYTVDREIDNMGFLCRMLFSGDK